MGMIIGLLIAFGILINVFMTGFNTLNTIYLVFAAIITIYNLNFVRKALGFSINKKRDRIFDSAVYIFTLTVILISGKFIFNFETTKLNAYYKECVSLIANGKIDKAEANLLKLKEKEPGNADVNQALATVYLKLGKTDITKKYLDEALKVKPYDEKIWFNYGMMYYKNKDYKNAQICYEKAISLNSDMVKAYIFAGYMSYNLRELRKALYYFKYADMLSSNSPEVLCHIARTYTELSDYKNAKEYYSLALSMKPSGNLKIFIEEGLKGLTDIGGGNK